MQKAIITIFFCSLMCSPHAQKTVLSTAVPSGINQPVETVSEDADYKIYTKVDTPASYAGGDSAWNLFLRNNLNITKLKDSIKIPEGKKEFTQTVFVKFIVSKAGELSDITAVNKDADKNCIAEAVRVLKRSRGWIPARLNGKPVNSYFIQPVNFSFKR